MITGFQNYVYQGAKVEAQAETTNTETNKYNKEGTFL